MGEIGLRLLRDSVDWQDAERRFWARVNKTDGCWLWTGALFHDGYGRFNWHRKDYSAHRVSYELAYGELEQGMVIDHICHTRACVRLDHIRQVTPKQNAENRFGPQRNNISGVLGVSWFPKSRKWRGQVAHDRKVIHVGLFTDIKDAEAAVVAKRNELFTHNDIDRVA